MQQIYTMCDNNVQCETTRGQKANKNLKKKYKNKKDHRF